MSAGLDIKPSADAPSSDSQGRKSRRRKCIASGQLRDMSELLRLALSPEGVVVPDIYGRLPGRGAWITPSQKMLDKAIEKNAFTRAFKGKVSVPAVLPEQIRTGLQARLLGMLGMANRAGALITGFDKVKSLAQSGKLAIRIEAQDGQADGRGKIRVITKALSQELAQPQPLVIGCFTAKELGKLVGHDHLVHGGIMAGPLAYTLKHEALRLNGFYPLIPPRWPDKAHEAAIDGGF